MLKFTEKVIHNRTVESSKLQVERTLISNYFKVLQIYPVKCKAIFVKQKLFNRVNSKSNPKSKCQKELFLKFGF